MAKIVNISEIHPTLGFTEFDILEKYRKSFNESELGKLHSAFSTNSRFLETERSVNDWKSWKTIPSFLRK